MYELLLIFILLAVFLKWSVPEKQKTVVCYGLSNRRPRNRVESDDKQAFGSYVAPFSLEKMGDYIRSRCWGENVSKTDSKVFKKRVQGSRNMCGPKNPGLKCRQTRYGRNKFLAKDNKLVVSAQISPNNPGRRVSFCAKTPHGVKTQTFYNSKCKHSVSEPMVPKKNESVITSTVPSENLMTEKTVSFSYFTKYCSYGKDYKFSRGCACTDCDNVVISYSYIMGLICNVCKPAAGKHLTFFRFINKKIDEKWYEWFCGCQECQDSDVTGCKLVRCGLCTTPKDIAVTVFVSDGESEK